MKRIKHRPMNSLLEAQIKLQEKRIHEASVDAFTSLKRPIGYPLGSFYSDRFIPKQEVL